MSQSSAHNPVDLHYYVYRVASPREFFIAGTINGLIAWWIFGSNGWDNNVLLSDWFKMIVPMGFILPFLTSFFGTMTGVLSRKQGKCSPSIEPNVSWLRFAILASALYSAAIGFPLLLTSIFFHFSIEDLSIPSFFVIGMTFFVSGLMAASIHGMSILSTLRWKA